MPSALGLILYAHALTFLNETELYSICLLLLTYNMRSQVGGKEARNMECSVASLNLVAET